MVNTFSRTIINLIPFYQDGCGGSSTECEKKWLLDVIKYHQTHPVKGIPLQCPVGWNV